MLFKLKHGGLNMDQKNKENAVNDFMQMTKESWTYARLTENERFAWEESVSWAVDHKVISGKYSQRYEILNALYYTFLLGVGYTGWKWREE
jgi:hypothetical protein